MSTEIKVPTLGESVTEATVARWLQEEGASVQVDDLLVELETDKITLEIPAPVSGVLKKVIVPVGETVQVGALVGVIEEGASSSPSFASSASTQLDPPIMPAAQKHMAEANLKPQQMKGTGKGGRILKEDVLRTKDVAPLPSQGTGHQSSVREDERVPMSRLRQRIGQRLKEAQNTAAILTTFNEIDMSSVIALRTRFKEDFEKRHQVRLGFMSFFTRACVKALQEIPALNAEIQDNTILYKNYYDLGVAVGTPQGLVVPILRNVENMSLADIEKEVGRLGTKAKEGKLAMDDLAGGTFTISNGGVYGSLLSTPILNPPQSGILGMHTIQKRPVAVDDTVQIRPMMYVALSYDHRLVDGQQAVTFLVRIKQMLEDPERLLLDI